MPVFLLKKKEMANKEKSVKTPSYLKIFKIKTEMITVVIMTLRSQRIKNSFILAAASIIDQVPFWLVLITKQSPCPWIVYFQMKGNNSVSKKMLNICYLKMLIVQERN